jgi:hypothetical protein
MILKNSENSQNSGSDNENFFWVTLNKGVKEILSFK